ncbi:MAG: cupin domain-containing protein [Candidatus Lokiarchaeota archaeon]|nr:cupin domain-containing protein [Candidatus Harpocratesius repetitus]
MNSEVKIWIEKLSLTPYPEGGYYRESYRSSQIIPGNVYVPPRSENRVSATSIYFLLEGDQHSSWHRLNSDEIWYFHSGTTVIIHTFSQEGKYCRFFLDNQLQPNHYPQILISAGTIFGAELLDNSQYALMGCMVTPGFDFTDFSIISHQELLIKYPNLSTIILKLRIKEE